MKKWENINEENATKCYLDVVEYLYQKLMIIIERTPEGVAKYYKETYEKLILAAEELKEKEAVIGKDYIYEHYYYLVKEFEYFFRNEDLNEQMLDAEYLNTAVSYLTNSFESLNRFLI